MSNSEAQRPRPKQYVALVDDEEFNLQVAGPDQVQIDEKPYAIQLESIDGESLFSLLVGNRSYEVFVEWGEDTYTITIDGERHQVRVGDKRLVQPAKKEAAPEPESGETPVRSPLTGVVVEVRVQEGQSVETGQVVAILEAMKMENAIRAPRDGVVKTIHVVAGQTVKTDEAIAYLDALGADAS